jgi:predicted nucleic acid-binding Zn ribbon protein
MSASPRIQCERCQGRCEKQLGMGAGIIFKGSGFYETDYKHKNGSYSESKAGGNGRAGSESKAKAASEKSESKSSAPKPDSGGATK